MTIGRSYEEVAEIIAGAERHCLPVGACIDTAHSFEAGYAIHMPAGLEKASRRNLGSHGWRKESEGHSRQRFQDRV